MTFEEPELLTDIRDFRQFKTRVLRMVRVAYPE